MGLKGERNGVYITCIGCDSSFYVRDYRKDSAKWCSFQCKKLVKSQSDQRVHSKEYKAFYDAKDRCDNPKNDHYRYYGARGIKFRYLSFTQFLNDLGQKPQSDYSLDRIDVNGDYIPGNCRWTSFETQANNRTDNFYITFDGRSQSLASWAKEFNLDNKHVYNRMCGGWTFVESIGIPVKTDNDHISNKEWRKQMIILHKNELAKLASLFDPVQNNHPFLSRNLEL